MIKESKVLLLLQLLINEKPAGGHAVEVHQPFPIYEADVWRPFIHSACGRVVQ
jgi:hypothetical protein